MYVAACESRGSTTEAGAISSADPTAFSTLRELFELEPRTWQSAFQIELQLTQVMSQAQLDTEWIRRLSEAEDLGLAHCRGLKAEYILDENEPQHLEKKRMLLQRLLNDLQWFYQQRVRRREAAKLLAVRVSWLFWTAFALFFILLFVQVVYGPASVSLGN